MCQWLKKKNGTNICRVFEKNIVLFFIIKLGKCSKELAIIQMQKWVIFFLTSMFKCNDNLQFIFDHPVKCYFCAGKGNLSDPTGEINPMSIVSYS